MSKIKKNAIVNCCEHDWYETGCESTINTYLETDELSTYGGNPLDKMTPISWIPETLSSLNVLLVTNCLNMGENLLESVNAR